MPRSPLHSSTDPKRLLLVAPSKPAAELHICGRKYYRTGSLFWVTTDSTDMHGGGGRGG